MSDDHIWQTLVLQYIVSSISIYRRRRGGMVLDTTDQLEFKNFIHSSLDDFYHRWAKRLPELELRETLQSKNTSLLRVVGVQRVSEISVEILRSYVFSTEEITFGQEELTEYPTLYSKLVPLVQNYVGQHRVEFEREWHKAINRFDYNFFHNFCNPDWSTNWEKLLRFSTRRENLPWISRDDLVFVTKYWDDDEDYKDMDDFDSNSEG